MLEPLTQAERDLVYEVRAYERFRKTFAVDVASRYYQVLSQMDEAKNAELNYSNLATLSERNRALANAGRLKWNVRDGKAVAQLDARVSDLTEALTTFINVARRRTLVEVAFPGEDT